MSLLAVACFFCLAAAGHAQGTNSGTIRGRVTDPNGASVAGASVKVTDLGTESARDLTTNDNGEYEATTLQPGNYSVTIVAANFKTTVVNVAVSGSDVVRADARLEIGAQDATVTVTQEAGLIQSESPTIIGNLTTRQLLALPRDSRDIYQFLYLNPNITTSSGGEGFKFIGAQSYGASFSLDGQRSNGGIFGEATSSQPSLEAIEELTVLSNNFSAEYAGIANIRVVTKRGESKYHGSLFANNKNSALAAWSIGDKNDLNAFTPNPANPDFPKPYYNLNEDGGSISGPVPGSKKTFFLGSYERRWSLTPIRFSSSRRLPGQRLLNGDFSDLSNSTKPLVPAGVILTPAEIASNTVGGLGVRFITIPSRLLNPTTARFVNLYYPKSSLSAPVDSLGRLSSFAQNVNQRTVRDLVTARVDHDFSANDKFYAVYNFQDSSGPAGAVAGGAYPAFGLRENQQTNHTLSLTYTRIFSQSVVNELRGGFNRQKLYRHAPHTLREILTSIGFSAGEITAYGAVVGPAALDTFGQPELRITNLATLTNGGRSVDRRLDQELMTFGDTLTWIKGGHAFKFGADTVRNRATDGFTANRGNPRGRIEYTGSNMDPFARFLLGLPANAARYVQKLRGPLDASNWEHGFFVMDDWKVTPRVTLNLGLRYELITPFIEKNNLLVNFDPNFINPTNHRHGRFVVPSAAVIPLIDPAMVAYGVVTADEAGVSRGLINADKNNFAPRIGLAWRLSDSSVLRGGYGIFFPTSAAQGIRDAFGSTPFNQGRRTRTRAGLSLGGWPGGLTPAGQVPISGGSLDAASTVPSANLIPFDLQQPRIQQYNVTFEHELGWKTGIRVSYLGSRLHGLIGGIDLNLLPPSNVPYGTRDEDGNPCVPDDFNCVASDADIARLPFPELGTFLLSYGNFGSGRSHAMQIELNRRFAGGFTFNASYTLLDQKGSGFDTANSSLGGTAYNQFHPENDFATDAFVSRHRFVSYGAIELPFGKGRKFGKHSSSIVEGALGGWELSWNMFAKSGTGFTPFYDCGNCDPIFPGNIASDSLDAVGGFGNYLSYRPLSNGSVSPYGGAGGAFFNPGAFAVPTVGADLLDNPNVIRRNALTGPSTWGANLGIRKKFRITETARLEVGADFNNVFNHPLRAPIDPDAAFEFTHIGTFFLDVDAQGRILPITRVDPNPNFGRLIQSYRDEGIDNRRTIRLRLRFTF
ncbi:MAG: carboxypeptidase regulatory-like domain-containing protein [Blastocatellia bacterium]|nr:carboxypeptidase regulatory-like domain-containing protein [Blastocatellia bacterium]